MKRAETLIKEGYKLFVMAGDHRAWFEDFETFKAFAKECQEETVMYMPVTEMGLYFLKED